MSHKILLTGASGYLGGTLLARWTSVNLPPYERLYALVRTEEQAKSVRQYAAAPEPLIFNIKDGKAVRSAVVDNEITIVYFLVDAFQVEAQRHFIAALAEVKKITGSDVHFLHVSKTFYPVHPRHTCAVGGPRTIRVDLSLSRQAEPKSSPAMVVRLSIGHCWTPKKSCTISKRHRFRQLLQSRQ